MTGGVASSLGKGIVSASLGRLLQSRGYRVTIQKLDPYINVDPGTMSPFQHGEVYVTDDGAETDLDLGHYERYTGQPTSQKSNVTAGRIYWDVLHKERTGVLMSRITNDVTIIKSMVSNAVTGALRDFFTVIGLTGVIFYTDWKLAILAVVVLPVATRTMLW